ncbi:MAG TPA: hypothetical protein VM327_07640 [Candidatus Thermoplasmatota archaeon]|nr:hypothetical protein [Candidatus Thermoplasmatota archaeon]
MRPPVGRRRPRREIDLGRTSEQDYQGLADEYEKSFELDRDGTANGPYGMGVAVVAAPFRLEHAFAALGPVHRGAGYGVLWREGGGWNVTYSIPWRVMGDGPYLLKTTPDNATEFLHEGRSNLEDDVLVAQLARFMADLGRETPQGVTFSHSHGD